MRMFALFATTIPLVALLSGCGQGLDGEWRESCQPSLLAPEQPKFCHAHLDAGTLALALIPEGDGWILATGWMQEDYQLVQSSFDAARIRRTVRVETGWCSGPVCWMEFTDQELERWMKRPYFRIELTRVFFNEEGRMRRGTRAFTAPTTNLEAWVRRGPTTVSDRDEPRPNYSESEP